jgi:hypothetical protein
MAYLADQVLTVEELGRYLQDHAHELPRACLAYSPGDPRPQKVVSDLQALLARRLLRMGRYREALAAFQGNRHADLASQYVKAMERAHEARDPIDRAQALFIASRLARVHGLEIMGTETAPDWSLEEANYDLASYPESRRYLVGSPAEPAQESPLPAKLRESLLTPTEAARLRAHAPPHPERFHYRETAADLAESAARLVPPHSQAYHAILCTAAKYVNFTNHKRFHQLWTEQVRHGALITDWAWEFGVTCPQPEFESARKMAAEARAWHWPRWRKRTIAAFATTSLAAGVGLAVLVIRRRRARQPRSDA